MTDLRTLEALDHGWDVGQGTGRPLLVDDAPALDRLIALLGRRVSD